LFIREVIAEAVVVGVDSRAGFAKGILDAAEVIERRRNAPASQRLARLANLFGSPATASCRRRLDLRRPQLAVLEPAGLHGADDSGRLIAARGARQFTEAVGLHAKTHAPNRLRGSEPRKGDRTECQGSEFAPGESRHHSSEWRP